MLRKRIGEKNNLNTDNLEELSKSKLKQEEQSKSYKKKSLKKVIIVLCSFGFILYVVLPLWFISSPWLRGHIIFLTYISWPPFLNLTVPEKFGLTCARNFYIESEPGINLGVWHILPKSRWDGCQKESFNWEKEFDDQRPVILYLHGNSGSRGGSHRVELYRVMSESKVDAHVVVFDYRGYGDSTLIDPTIAGVVQDAKVMYNWLKKRVDKSRIFIWGHSLGTGVTIRLAERLSVENDNPMGIVLESAFDSLWKVGYHHPISSLHRFLPYFEHCFVEPVRQEDPNFDSEEKVGHITAPMLILHAEDDLVVPFALGKNLFNRARKERPSYLSPVEMIKYNSELGYGHKYICRDPGLADVIFKFITDQKSLV
ncbi:monoacylglycerol lipase ABHD12-like [Limulus polyphemus]|uniref:Monoacylglycerol lipase ABHD12-like n=1 Tax=Limulus polyphemus TaxID=6850 RepID=A0ABM1S4Q4_LIMPO|nr:monoacylglycerol lipase ABHD12-like [Limulus polyphemus]